MTLDQIDRMVRQANPVSDLKALERVDVSVLKLVQQRRTEMETQDRVKVDQVPEKPTRGLLIGIAAAAVIAIGALVLFQPRDDAPVAAEPASPVETATAYLEAYASFDVDRAVTYLAADADLSPFDGGVGDLGVEGLRLELRFLEAQGFKLLLDSCEERDSSPSGTVVRCTYDLHAIRSDEIGLGPYGGNWFDIGVLEGEVASVSGHIPFMTNGFSSQMWEPFAHWVAETYPEDAAIMYTDASQTMQRITEESIALWELRSREYVEVVKSPSG